MNTYILGLSNEVGGGTIYTNMEKTWEKRRYEDRKWWSGDKFCPSEVRDGENNDNNKQHLLRNY